MVMVFTRENRGGSAPLNTQHAQDGEKGDEAVFIRGSITKEDPPNAHQAQHKGGGGGGCGLQFLLVRRRRRLSLLVRRRRLSLFVIVTDEDPPNAHQAGDGDHYS